jgi:hypothetical protein
MLMDCEADYIVNIRNAATPRPEDQPVTGKALAICIVFCHCIPQISGHKKERQHNSQ